MRKFFDSVNPRFYIFLSGILLGLTVIFAKLGIFAYIVLIPLGVALFKKFNSENYNFRKAYTDGFIFYMSYDLVCFHWFIYFYPLEFAGFNDLESVAIVLIAWVGLSLLQSVFSAFVFVLLLKLSRSAFCRQNTVAIPFFAAALWTVNEWTQTFTWAGVPWSSIGISQTEMPIMMQPASLFGSCFLTFIIVLFNFLIAYAIAYPEKRKLVLRGAACMLAVYILIGSALYFIPTKDEDRYVGFASIQENLESQTSYHITVPEIYEILERQTRLAAENGAKVILWSECSFGVDIRYRFIYDSKIASLEERVSALAEELGVTVIVGAYIAVDDKDYNAISVFYPNGESIINAQAKMRPVPFGEYIPMRDFITSAVPILAEINFFGNDVFAGEEYTPFDSSTDENSFKIGALICFDSIYGEIALGLARAGAEVFVVPSNDSWFYDSRALNIHHAHNILRSVEQGKYTVNCGNTGITSIINDKGEIVAEMPIYTEGYVLDTVYASSYRTLYSYIGNLFVYLCIAFIAAPMPVDCFLNLKSRKNEIS